MQKFSFYSPEDYDSGIYLNARRRPPVSTSPYNVTSLKVDSTPFPNTSVYFATNPLASPAPWTNIGGRDYETTTPYAVYTIPASQTLGAYDVDIVFDVGLSNAFAKQYLDGQNLPNIDTYYTQNNSGFFKRSHISLEGTIGQNIAIYHSGFANKNAQTKLGPIDILGRSLTSAITITPNTQTSVLQENWTVVANPTNWSLKRASTGTTTPYGYNIPYSNIVPGFNIFVNNSGVVSSDQASLATYPSKLDLMFYTLYTALAPTGKWISPILDSRDDATHWMLGKYQHASKSTSAYLENIRVGQTSTPDSTWQTYVPPTISVQDFAATKDTTAYRQSVVDLGNLQGRFAQAQFTISSYTEFVQAVDLYCWNPTSDPIMRLQGPIVQGDVMQKFMAAFGMAITDWQTKYNCFLESFAISTAQREYLFKKGELLNTPIRINETLEAYRNRLEIVAQGLTNAGTLSYMQSAIRAYTGTTQAYIKELLHSNLTWQMGSSSIGINTFTGEASFNVWSYEVHVPGAGDYDPDGLVKFVYYLNPVGAVPVFIFE